MHEAGAPEVSSLRRTRRIGTMLVEYMQGTPRYKQLVHEAKMASPERILEFLESESSAEIHWPDSTVRTVRLDEGLAIVTSGEPVIWRFGLLGYFRSKFAEHVVSESDELLRIDLDGHTFRFDRKPGGWHGVSEEACLDFDRKLRGNILNIKLAAYDALGQHLA